MRYLFFKKKIFIFIIFLLIILYSTFTNLRPVLIGNLFQLHRPRVNISTALLYYYLIISVSLIFYLCLNKGVVILSLVCNSSPLI